MKRIACSIAAAALVALVAWLFGFDFDKRGFDAGMVAVMATLTGVWTYFFPGWTE